MAADRQEQVAPTTIVMPLDVVWDIKRKLGVPLIEVGFTATPPKAALLAVLNLHRRRPTYKPCGHDHENGERGVLLVHEVGLVCDSGYEFSVCRECCTDGDNSQTEHCAENHMPDLGGCWPCPTVRAIGAALGLSSVDEGNTDE